MTVSMRSNRSHASMYGSCSPIQSSVETPFSASTTPTWPLDSADSERAFINWQTSVFIPAMTTASRRLDLISAALALASRTKIRRKFWGASAKTCA